MTATTPCASRPGWRWLTSATWKRTPGWRKPASRCSGSPVPSWAAGAAVRAACPARWSGTRLGRPDRPACAARRLAATVYVPTRPDSAGDPPRPRRPCRPASRAAQTAVAPAAPSAPPPRAPGGPHPGGALFAPRGPPGNSRGGWGKNAPPPHPLVSALALAPHPEGGWYRQTWRSPTVVRAAGYPGPRAAATAIHFLLAGGEGSRWHRVRSDEVWLWQGAGPPPPATGGPRAPPEPGPALLVG